MWSNAHPDLVIYAYLVLRVIETDMDRLRDYRDMGQVSLPDYLAD